MDWKKIALTTVWVWSGVKSAQMCRLLCLSKLSAWMCLHPDDPLGHSHTYWCSLLPWWDFTLSQFVLRNLAAARLRLLYVSYLSRTTHIHAQPHILNYLSSSGTHTHTPTRRLLTGLLIAAILFCIHMRKPQQSLSLSPFLSYEYKIVKAESKEILKICFISLFSISSPYGDSFDTWLNYFILLRGNQVQKESPRL